MEKEPTVVAADDGESRGDSTNQHLTNKRTRKGKERKRGRSVDAGAQKGSVDIYQVGVPALGQFAA